MLLKQHDGVKRRWCKAADPPRDTGSHASAAGLQGPLLGWEHRGSLCGAESVRKAFDIL